MVVADLNAKLTQLPEALEYLKFCRAVEMAWSKGHPDIPLVAQGSKLFDNNKPVITYHLQRRSPIDSTPKRRVMESFDDDTSVTNLNGVVQVTRRNVQTYRQEFENTIVFSIHVPVEKGGGEVADMLCEEFERFMVEHTGLFMRLGAKHLTYAVRFHDDNLLREMSLESVRRFISYTLHTQIVTQTTAPNLQRLEAEIRASLDSTDTITLTEEAEE